MINIFQPVGSSPTTTQGDLIVRGATSDGRLAIGANATVLTSNGTTATWAAPAGGGLTIGTTTITSGTSTRILFDAAGVVSETDGATWDATNKALTIGGATVATSKPILDLSQTWNAGAVTFTGLKLNVTNTASATASLLLDLQVGGATTFKVARDGTVTSAMNGGMAFGAQGGTAGIGRNGSIGGLNFYGAAYSADGAAFARLSATDFHIQSGHAFAWNSTANVNTAIDTFLYRKAAASVQMGANVNGAAIAQSFGSCAGITGTDKTGADMTLFAGPGTGAGAVSSLIFQTPTVLGSGTTAQSLATRLTLTSAAATVTVPVVHGTNYGEWTEMTAPAAGAANTVRLYAQDNGAGKTQLMALFASGVAQQVAIEP